MIKRLSFAAMLSAILFTAPAGAAEPLVDAQRRHLPLLFSVHQVVVVLHRHELRPAVPLGDGQGLHQLPGEHGARPDVEDLSIRKWF